MTIRKLFFNATALSGAKLLATASQILVLPIIARHLTPHEFGVVALAMTFVLFTMAITDAGLGSSLVRTDMHDNRVWSSAFWFVGGLGLGLAALMAALAPLVALWYAEPELQAVLLTLAVVPVLQGMLAVPQAEMQKRGAILQIAFGELLGTFAGLGVAIWIATAGGGAWALVAQQLVFWLIRSINIIYTTQLRPEWTFSWSALGEHLRFGRDTVGFALVRFAVRQSHNLVIGKFLGPYPLGIYSMATRFANLPTDVIGGPVFYALYAHLAAMRDDKSAMRHTILAVSRLLAIIIFAPMALVAAGSEAFFTFFLSEKWSGVSTVFLLIAPAGALNGVAILYGTVLMATGETGLRLRIAVEMAVYWLALLFCAISFGIKTVALANTFWFVSYFPRLTRLFLKSLECDRQSYIGVLLGPAIIAVVSALAHTLVARTMDLTSMAEVALLVIELMLAWGITLVVEKPKITEDTRYLRTIIATYRR
jgi:O-antigen/teichoic acid export membrane protein